MNLENLRVLSHIIAEFDERLMAKNLLEESDFE
jgi:hypothetical protein